MPFFVSVLCVLCAFVVKNPSSPAISPRSQVLLTHQLSTKLCKATALKNAFNVAKCGSFRRRLWRVMYTHIFDVMKCHVFVGLTSHFLSCRPARTRSMGVCCCRPAVGLRCGWTPKTVHMWGNVGEFHSHPFATLSCPPQSKGQRQPHGYRCPSIGHAASQPVCAVNQSSDCRAISGGTV
jgi:hypothetical protein